VLAHGELEQVAVRQRLPIDDWYLGRRGIALVANSLKELMVEAVSHMVSPCSRSVETLDFLTVIEYVLYYYRGGVVAILGGAAAVAAVGDFGGAVGGGALVRLVLEMTSIFLRRAACRERMPWTTV